MSAVAMWFGVAVLLAANASGAAASDQYAAARAHANALLVQHHYKEALQLARELNHRMADDLTVYGIMIDADIALGDLKDAEKQAQWMLDLGLRQPNVAGLVRVARLRVLFDDPEGALELINQALSHTPETEAERRATLLGFGAWVLLIQGKPGDAAATVDTALRVSSRNACALTVAERVRGNAKVKPGDCPCDLSF